jgi:hypothetical protein
VQSQPIPALHTHYAPPQTTDQTLRVQIRRDHRRPSFHAPTRASRRICLFANALHALPRAAMVIHTQYNVIYYMFPLSIIYSTIYSTWYQSHFLVAPIGVNDVFRCSYRRPSSHRRTKRYSHSFSGAPSSCRPSPADRAVSSSGNFCPSLSRRHRHPSRPKKPPKVVSKPRIGGSVQSQPIPALHAHYAPHQMTDQTLRVQI